MKHLLFYTKSTQEFHQFKEQYVHRSRQVFDTGLELETLQEYILIPLDIFKESMHNKNIENELDAWLSFMAFDELERIIELIESYPQFKAMYEEVYEMCRNIERVMQMYSKELAELDRNTVQYMIEEQEKMIKELSEKLNQKDEKLSEKEEVLSQREEQLSQKEEQLSQRDEQLSRKDEQLILQAEEIAALRRKLEELSQK